MRSRMLLWAAGVLGCTTVCASSMSALEFREEPYRVGIIDVGEPILLDYTELTNEMNVNLELRDWIESFGRPEYAEYQKVALSDPFLPYEIRLYYIEGRKYVAFGRVAVSPALSDYGVRKYVGKLDSAMLQRLLTARPLEEAARMAATEQIGYETPLYQSPTVQSGAAAPVVVETEEVVEIVSPETVVITEEAVVEVDSPDGAVEAEIVVDEVEVIEVPADGED